MTQEAPDRVHRNVEHAGQTGRGSITSQISRFPGTFILIGITLAFYLGQILSKQMTGADWVLGMGAKSKFDILNGEVWRIVTPLFIHVGITHLFVNMYSLYALGPAVERFFSTSRYLVVYFLSGIGGVALSLALSPFPSVGASGAIFGLLGSLGTFLYLHKDLFGRLGRLQLRQIVFVGLLNIALGLAPGIDQWGHLGGLFTGIFLTWVIGPRFIVEWTELGEPRYTDTRPWSTVRAKALFASGVILLLTVLAIWIPPASSLLR
jgi:rhomboid protease GluP